MPVEFTWEFNVERSTRGDYRDFIQKLRRQLGVRSSHNRPALAVQENDNPSNIRFFDLVLRTNEYSVRFRFRSDNLYLIGYQMQDGQWLEFGRNGDQHLITEPRTDFLGFDGSYGRLQQIANRRIEETRVGVHNLVFAINQLAVTTVSQFRARALVVVIMMISESTRLIPVSNHMAESFDNRRGTTLDSEGLIQPWIIDLVRSWDTLSAALLLADAHPGERFRLRENNIRIPPNNSEIRTIAQAAEVLGILLGICFKSNGPKRSPRMTSDDYGKFFPGLPLVQVFSVRINNIDDEDPGELYGTITINNGLYTQYIYNRTRNNYESIRPGQHVTLTGPSESVSALGNFTIKLVLTDKDIISWDDIIMDQVISWDVANMGNVYDKLISPELKSPKNIGSVTVNYAVLRNAVAAKFTVTLKEGGEATSEVYGHVSACYDNWVDHETTCLLFDRTSDNYVKVDCGQNIPLLRSVVAVPLNDSLKVTAHLYDNDFYMSGDDGIANETKMFPVPETIPNTTCEDFKGEDGNWVRVKIDWSSGL